MKNAKEQFWNDKEYKPMKKNPLNLTKKDVLNFDPIFVLDFNNKEIILDGNHRWVVSKKLKSKNDNSDDLKIINLILRIIKNIS